MVTSKTSPTEAETTPRRRATKLGTVISDKMNKTVVVAVENRVLQPMYQKYVKRTSHFRAHDETNECHAGDRVLIEESRPLSKTKRWVVKEILSRAS